MFIIKTLIKKIKRLFAKKLVFIDVYFDEKDRFDDYTIVADDWWEAKELMEYVHNEMFNGRIQKYYYPEPVRFITEDYGMISLVPIPVNIFQAVFGFIFRKLFWRKHSFIKAEFFTYYFCD